MIERNIVQQIQLAPEELASEFCEMDAEQQARFFNHIGLTVANKWDRSFAFQMQNIVDSPELKDSGKYILGIIRDYME